MDCFSPQEWCKFTSVYPAMRKKTPCAMKHRQPGWGFQLLDVWAASHITSHKPTLCQIYAQGTNIFFKSRSWVTLCMSIKLKAQSRLHNWTTLRISSSETAAEVKWSTFSGFFIVTNISVQWGRTEEERRGEIRVRWWSHSSYASCLAPLSLSSGALRPDSAAEPGCFVWLIWSRGVHDEGAIGKLESIPALNTYPLPPVGRCFPFCLTLCVCLFSVCIEDEARESAVLVVVSSVGFSTIQFDVNFVPCVQMEDDAVRGVVIVLVRVLGNSTGTNLEQKKPK